MSSSGLAEREKSTRPLVSALTVDAARGSAAAEGPIDEEAFAALMSRLGPFEPAPSVAVALSGGPDSMALCLLTDRWARGHGGSLLALTVDHGLRSGSRDETRTVAQWLESRRIAHRVLTWRDHDTRGSVQAAARAARYRLLERACAEAGILHLLLAHTLDDQAETVLLRLSKGSGIDGLAAMAPIRETAGIRLLRPLLGTGKSRLRETCTEFRQDWLEDPSNGARHFARGRLRRVSSVLAEEGLTPARLADTARRAGRARSALDAATGALMARAVSIYPEGYALLDRAVLMEAPEEFALRALSRCLLTIGAADHPPRLDRLERLYQSLLRGNGSGGRTLAGCRIVPDKAGRLLICREPAATEVKSIALANGRTSAGKAPAPVPWDRRFLVAPPAGGLPDGLEIRKLGAAGRTILRSEGMASDRLPAIAALSLPGLWDGDGLFALPQIVTLQNAAISCRMPVCGVRFVPSRRLTDPAFVVA